MPRRARLIDFRTSDGPENIGLCQGDKDGCARAVNAAQTRLVLAREAGDTGWWGSWARIVFNVATPNTTITTPRSVARLERLDVCKHPVKIQNEFYEFLDFSRGLEPKTVCNNLETYERGTFPTFSDIVPRNKVVRAFITTADDIGRRVLYQGTDQNALTIYSTDGLSKILGIFVVLASPFVDSPMEITALTGIQKDVTTGPVQFFEVDVTTGNQRLILTMEPSETVAAYRRYFVNGIPSICCDGCAPQVVALAKLELIPVKEDTDYLLIQNIEALILECQAIRHSKMDSDAAKQQSAVEHRDAIRLLQGELVHYEGKDRPAIVYKPFGSARLEHRRIGSLI